MTAGLDEHGEPPEEAVNAVLLAWARCSPSGSVRETLRAVDTSVLHGQRNLARLAAKAALGA